MKIIQIIPIAILQNEYKSEWIYEISFWQGIALSLLKNKQYGRVVLYTDSDGYEVLIKQLNLPYDEVNLIENNCTDFSICVVNILANVQEGFWVNTDIYALSDLAFIKRNTFYFWNGEPLGMLSASRIYENNLQLRSLFHKLHHWGGYFIFDGIFQNTLTFWKSYYLYLKKSFPLKKSIAIHYHTDYKTTDSFILKYLLSVYARENGYVISENLDKVTLQNIDIEAVIKNLNNLPFIQANDELKKSTYFNDLVGYLLFEESPSIFSKIQHFFEVNSAFEDSFFTRTQQCIIIMNDSKKQNSLTKDIFKYETKRKRFITNINVKSYPNYNPFYATQYLANSPISDILESKWQLKNNNIMIESQWKWDMDDNTNLNYETYAKLKIFYNKCEPAGFYNTLICMNQLNNRISEVHLNILQVLFLYYLKKPKKIKTVIKRIEKIIFKKELMPDHFDEKCIQSIKLLALINCIEKI